MRNWFNKKKELVYNYLKRKLYNWENSQYFDNIVEDSCDVYYVTKNRPKLSIFSPVIVVIREIELLYSPCCFKSLGIMGIYVDTQDEKLVSITIQLKRPGLLIGKGGKDIDNLQDRLKNLFNRPVVIKIDEVRKDINEPVRYY